MATDMHLSQIQAVIGYIFRDPNNLVEALTAAGADEQKYDGNKQMAQLGESIIKAVILDNAFTICATRGATTRTKLKLHVLTISQKWRTNAYATPIAGKIARLSRSGWGSQIM